MTRERAGTISSPLAWSRLLYSILFVGVAIAGLYIGSLTYVQARQLAARTSFKSIPIILRPSLLSRQEAYQPEQLTVAAPAVQPVKSAPVNNVYPDIETQEPVNILVLGIDQRAGESTICRTDTMILVSVDPKGKSVSLLSIPRDLWVRIPHPKHEHDKITTAHYWGEVENYPGGGPALAMKTVHDTVGIRPHYFVRLNFTGFESIIDRIGGIDVDVPVTIDDEKYPNESYGYERLYIEAGRQHFDGNMALKYARTRYGSDDFTRMDRQQQIIMAVRERVLNLENLPQLLRQLPQIYRSMGDSIETDIPIDLMLQMAEWALQIERENIRMDSIDRRMTTDATRPDGAQVLIYNPDKARPIIDELFRVPTPEVQASETTQVKRLEAEKAQVVVYNGTAVSGLAGRVSSFLRMQGIDVRDPQNADSFDYEQTVLNVYSDKPFTVDWLVNMFGISPENVIYHSSQGKDDVDVSIVIGQDFPASEFK